MNLENNNMDATIDNKKIPDDELDQVSGGTDPVIIDLDPSGPLVSPIDPADVINSIRVKTDNPHHTIKGDHGPRR